MHLKRVLIISALCVIPSTISALPVIKNDDGSIDWNSFLLGTAVGMGTVGVGLFLLSDAAVKSDDWRNWDRGEEFMSNEELVNCVYEKLGPMVDTEAKTIVILPSQFNEAGRKCYDKGWKDIFELDADPGKLTRIPSTSQMKKKLEERGARKAADDGVSTGSGPLKFSALPQAKSVRNWAMNKVHNGWNNLNSISAQVTGGTKSSQHPSAGLLSPPMNAGTLPSLGRMPAGWRR
ncbi:MAG: hypothetical protein M1816_005051 [Peltula sp. TS41687]|nr:MAG: hypothetical protein M1816_005051 [Peltula sp. TS41687]